MPILRVVISLVMIILKVMAAVIVQLMALLASSLVALAVAGGLLVLVGYAVAALLARRRGR